MMQMSSWLELLLNIVGYGGFIVIASRHHAHTSDDASQDVGSEMH